MVVKMRFQSYVHNWVTAAFGHMTASDKVEWADRLLEEVLELLQSGGYDFSRIPALVEYVNNRPVGEPFQEVGGVMVTLASYCTAHDQDMDDAGWTELERCWHKIELIREKQKAKARDIPNSPLPQKD